MQNMKIMKAAWVHNVWRESIKENVLATSKQFDVYQVPIFYNLRVTTTGLSKREKKEVEDAVRQGEGTYCGEFSSGTIDVVIAKRNTQETHKLRAALNLRKDCLCVEWIYDSVKKGIALPIELYRIDLQAKKHTSTPEKPNNESQFNNTRTSGIDISNIHFTATINDSAMSNLSIASDVGILSRKQRNSNDPPIDENKDVSYKVAFEKLDVQKAKKAGTFLDGCNVRFSQLKFSHLKLYVLCQYLLSEFDANDKYTFLGFHLRFHIGRKGKNCENSERWRCHSI